MPKERVNSMSELTIDSLIEYAKEVNKEIQDILVEVREKHKFVTDTAKNLHLDIERKYKG